jgi:predicted nucleic acid-binding protein
LPTAPELLVVNTGPLIALGRVDALEIVGKLPIKFVAPSQVAGEIEAGSRLGHPVTMPGWVDVQPLAAPLARVAVATLDEGEAAVIQLALERAIETVCIDEWRGRRAATAAGLRVTGSLGLLGRSKRVGLIDTVRPWVTKLGAAGVTITPTSWPDSWPRSASNRIVSNPSL